MKTNVGKIGINTVAIYTGTKICKSGENGTSVALK